MAAFFSFLRKLDKRCLLRKAGLGQEFRLKKKYMKGLYTVELLAKRHGSRETDGSIRRSSVLNIVQKLTATYGAQAKMKPELIMKAICRGEGNSEREGGDTSSWTRR